MAYDKGIATKATRIGPGRYSIDSFRGEEKAYEVNLQTATCTCPHFTQRLAGTREECKHLTAVRAQIRASQTPRPPVGTSVKVWGPRTDEEAMKAVFA